MDSLNEEDAIINLKLLKRWYFYHLIDQSAPKVFGRNVYRIIFVAIIAIIQGASVYANAGFFLPVDYSLMDVEFFLVLVADLLIVLTFYKVWVLFYRLDDIAELLDVTRVDFLTSRLCRQNNGILRDYRVKIVRYTDAYSIFYIVVIVQWTITAFLTNSFSSYDYKAHGERIPTVIQMPFPVNVRTHNRYYGAFFITESIISFSLLYCLLLIDTYLLSYGWIITAQYEVLSRAFEDLNGRRCRVKSWTMNTNDNRIDNDVHSKDDFKQLLSDQLNLILKLKSFQAIVQSIIFVIVTVSSGIIVILTVVFILIYSSSELSSTEYLLKVSSSNFSQCLQLYLYCNLFYSLNFQRESINLAMYSSNWTEMDFDMKQLLLMAMRMNDANPMQMKVSPKKIINLQLFANVMSTCYNITSVMAKSLSTKK